MFAALANWWWRPRPASRLACLRVLVALFTFIYMSVRGKAMWICTEFPAHRFAPTGVVKILDGPAPTWVFGLTLALSILSAATMTLGWKFRWSSIICALSTLWVISYRNSWGMIFHSENLVVLHLGILACSRAADVWALDARGHTAEAAGEASGRYGWPIRLVCLSTTIAYFIAGYAKLYARGFEWSGGITLQRQIAYDNLRKIALGDTYAPVGVWLLEHPWVFGPLAFVTLICELAAPVAILGDRIGRWWVASIWSFHIGVLITMAILFIYPVCGVAFAGFFALENTRMGGWVARWTGCPPLASSRSVAT